MSKDKGKFDNVILFPENKIKKQPTMVDPKAQKKMRDYQTTKFVETACDKIGLDMIKEFAQMQLDMKQDNFTKDLAFVIDSIRALLYRQFSMNYPMQKVIDTGVKLNMNKQGVVTARIEYANLTDESTATTKPMNKNVSDELNNRNNGMFMFTEDFEFNPFPGEDPNDDGPPSDTEK